MTRAIDKPTATPTVKQLAVQVTALSKKVSALAADGGKAISPRAAGELGAGGRWRWCEQWWRHDEAVTILTALWYG